MHQLLQPRRPTASDVIVQAARVEVVGSRPRQLSQIGYPRLTELRRAIKQYKETHPAWATEQPDAGSTLAFGDFVVQFDGDEMLGEVYEAVKEHITSRKPADATPRDMRSMRTKPLPAYIEVGDPRITGMINDANSRRAQRGETPIVFGKPSDSWRGGYRTWETGLFTLYVPQAYRFLRSRIPTTRAGRPASGLLPAPPQTNPIQHEQVIEDAVSRPAGHQLSRSTAMGGWSATQYARRIGGIPDDEPSVPMEWLHLIANSIGGPNARGNLVAGTEDANTAMIPFENAVKRMARGASRTNPLTYRVTAKLQEGSWVAEEIHMEVEQAGRTVMWGWRVPGKLAHPMTDVDYDLQTAQLTHWLEQWEAHQSSPSPGQFAGQVGAYQSDPMDI